VTYNQEHTVVRKTWWHGGKDDDCDDGECGGNKDRGEERRDQEDEGKLKIEKNDNRITKLFISLMWNYLFTHGVKYL